MLGAYLDRGLVLRHEYGLIDAAPVVSLLDEREAAARRGSVGTQLPFVDVPRRAAPRSAVRPGRDRRVVDPWPEHLRWVLGSPAGARGRRLVPDRRRLVDRRR